MIKSFLQGGCNETEMFMALPPNLQTASICKEHICKTQFMPRFSEYCIKKLILWESVQINIIIWQLQSPSKGYWPVPICNGKFDYQCLDKSWDMFNWKFAHFSLQWAVYSKDNQRFTHTHRLQGISFLHWNESTNLAHSDWDIAPAILQMPFSNSHSCMKMYFFFNISLKFVPKCPIVNKQSLLQIMPLW